eukprot:6200091-Pleurochrysis_carterae.AAC.2
MLEHRQCYAAYRPTELNVCVRNLLVVILPTDGSRRKMQGSNSKNQKATLSQQQGCGIKSVKLISGNQKGEWLQQQQCGIMVHGSWRQERACMRSALAATRAATGLSESKIAAELSTCSVKRCVFHCVVQAQAITTRPILRGRRMLLRPHLDDAGSVEGDKHRSLRRV